ncbi:hypothetical protein JOM56_014440, partial [Amanita muscaria]
GLPVMIRNNDATELCITKGQEGHVVGWQCTSNSQNKSVLDTLFVKLDKPAKIITLDGLPENVVPISRSSRAINCVTPSGMLLKINRSQVLVLPNFAMTDYASQGKTRLINIVDLNSCRDHLSYYTCLSRSATSEGTIIIQGFDQNKITCGASGYLRQEFRELELLNEITKLKYNSLLPEDMQKLQIRNTLIRQFQTYKGRNFVPTGVPKNLQWSDIAPMKIILPVADSPWKLILKDNQNQLIANKSNEFQNMSTNVYIPAKGTIPLNDKFKRKYENSLDEDLIQSKKRKTCKWFKPSDIAPVGLSWDSINYSCAYDALFTILINIWIQDPKKWAKVFQAMNNPLSLLSSGCVRVLQEKTTLEVVRNEIRQVLHQYNCNTFPYGQSGTNIAELADKLFELKSHAFTTTLKCTSCSQSVHMQSNANLLLNILDNDMKNINEWFKAWQQKSEGNCAACASPQNIVRDISQVTKLVAFSLNGKGIPISKTISIYLSNNKTKRLSLRGIVYLGDFHFTCRIICPDKDVWFHDGIITKQFCTNQGMLKDISERDLLSCNLKHAVLVIYGNK